eukprot:SAG22_NODE_333_length_12162_cov_11.415237_2_plen_166_part_00
MPTAWVKTKGRQGGGTNLETQNLDTAGRLFIDLVGIANKALPKLRTNSLIEIATAILDSGSSSGGDELSAIGDTACPWLSGKTLAGLWQQVGGVGVDGSGLQRLQLYAGSRASTARLCLEKLGFVVEQVSIARVTGCKLTAVWTRGEMIKSVNMLLRACRKVIMH